MTRSQSPRPSSFGPATILRHARCGGSLADRALGDLARQVAVDGRQRRLDAVLGESWSTDVEPGHGRDMGDAIAHLACADDADRP
jgi:hypothetical protein